jgi:hypothetical protein
MTFWLLQLSRVCFYLAYNEGLKQVFPFALLLISSTCLININSDSKGVSNNLSHVRVKVKRVQRAMIFQAGVALGAYEAGVFQALVKKISEVHRKRGLKNKRPLDIVAGASIGAMNAAVVVSNAIKSKSWEHSAEELVRF